MLRWFAEQQYGKCDYGKSHGKSLPWEAPDMPNCAIAQTHLYGECYSWDVEMMPTDPKLSSAISKESFGYNWTEGFNDQPLTDPYVYMTAQELGSNSQGQESASTTATYNSLPTDGFVAVLIPFFSPVLLPDQEGRAPGEVIDHREYAYNVSRGAAPANYFCLRMSSNGRAVRQICDPNDEAGRTTGEVKAKVHEFWMEMKQRRFIDPQTRVLSFTLPVRANHAKVVTRLTIML